MNSDGPAALLSHNRLILLVLLLILIAAGICGMLIPKDAVPDVPDRTYGLSWPEIWERYAYYPAQEWFSAQSYQLFSETAAAYPGQIAGVQYDGTVILWVNGVHPLSEEEMDSIYHQWSSSAESAGVAGLPLKFVFRSAPVSPSTDLILTADRNGVVRSQMYIAQRMLSPDAARVFRLLAESDGLKKEELGARLDLSLSTIEWHLGRFVRCGVVEKTEESRYRLSPEAGSVWDSHSSDSF